MSGVTVTSQRLVDPVTVDPTAALTVTSVPGVGLSRAEADALYAPIGAGGAVDSVNGHTGVVVLAATDVGADASGAAATAQAAAASDATTKANAAQAASQPLDSDLTAIAALSTTAYGRAFLALADAAAGRTVLGLGTAATTAASAYDAAGAAAAAQAASQPLDSDLTAIAALTTTATGRSLLAGADAAALRTILALGTAATISATAGGDLSGTLPSPTVAKINGIAVTGTPAVGYVPTATGSSAATWQAAAGGATDGGIVLSGTDDYDFNAAGVTSLPSGYSWEQQGASTYREEFGRGSIKWDTSAFNYIRAIYRTMPGTFNSCLVKFSSWAQGANTSNQGPGLVLRNSSSGKIAHFGMRLQQTLNVTFFSAASSGTVGTDLSLAWNPSGVLSNVYIKIVRNSSTSWDFQLGSDPNNLSTVFAATDVTAASQGFTPDQIGFGYLCIPATSRGSSIDYIKFT